MVRRAMASVLLALALLATAALLFLILVVPFVAASPMGYFLYGLLLLVLVWWAIRSYVRVSNSRASADTDRALPDRVERIAKTGGVDALILGGVALVTGVVLNNTCTTGMTAGGVSVCYQYGYQDVGLLAIVVGVILAVVGVVLLATSKQPRRAP